VQDKAYGAVQNVATLAPGLMIVDNALGDGPGSVWLLIEQYDDFSRWFVTIQEGSPFYDVTDGCGMLIGDIIFEP
jgi:hypothetical protein